MDKATLHVCARVKIARELFERLDIETFAKRLGVSRREITDIEAGLKAPTMALMAKLVTRFMIDPRWLLTGKSKISQQQDDSYAAFRARLKTPLPVRKITG